MRLLTRKILLATIPKYPILQTQPVSRHFTNPSQSRITSTTISLFCFHLHNDIPSRDDFRNFPAFPFSVSSVAVPAWSQGRSKSDRLKLNVFGISRRYRLARCENPFENVLQEMEPGVVGRFLFLTGANHSDFQ